MAIYVFSYTWRNAGAHHQRHYETEVSRTHPLLIVKEWREELDGNNNARLLWYHEIGEEQLGNLKLQEYLDWALDENMGEL